MASSQWLNVLNYFDSEEFGITDPVFQNDIGFYKSVEIIQQEKPGDWSSVFKKVEAKLDLTA